MRSSIEADSVRITAGCKVGVIKKKRSSHVKKGTVVSQGVSTGKSVASGTKLGLVVSKGKQAGSGSAAAACDRVHRGRVRCFSRRPA